MNGKQNVKKKKKICSKQTATRFYPETCKIQSALPEPNALFEIHFNIIRKYAKARQVISSFRYCEFP